MGKKISELKRKDIRCLVIEDIVNNRVFKVHEKDKIEEALKTYSDIEITKIYNPSAEVKSKIYNLMDKQLENNKAKSSIKETDMLIKVIPMVTDIEMDLDAEEDINIINEIIADPTEVLDEVILEVNKIILKMNLDWIENLKLIGQLPDDIINLLGNMNIGASNGKEEV